MFAYLCLTSLFYFFCIKIVFVLVSTKWLKTSRVHCLNFSNQKLLLKNVKKVSRNSKFYLIICLGIELPFISLIYDIKILVYNQLLFILFKCDFLIQLVIQDTTIH